MAPSAPGLFSTNTGWPRVSESGGATMRVMASEGPPGILRSRWNRNEAQSCYGGEDAHQLLHGLLYVHALVLPLRFMASSGLLRLESSGASRAGRVANRFIRCSQRLRARIIGRCGADIYMAGVICP